MNINFPQFALTKKTSSYLNVIKNSVGQSIIKIEAMQLIEYAIYQCFKELLQQVFADVKIGIKIWQSAKWLWQRMGKGEEGTGEQERQRERQEWTRGGARGGIVIC